VGSDGALCADVEVSDHSHYSTEVITGMVGEGQLPTGPKLVWLV
jgi:hypothetical protein